MGCDDRASSGGSADALVCWALEELDSVPAPEASRAQTLLRSLEAIAHLRQANALQRWCSVMAVQEATQPIEDELFRTQRALRRANSSLTASLQRAKA